MDVGVRIDSGKGYYLRRATENDIQELLTLYFIIYGTKYPLSLGTDRTVMKNTILAPDNLWILAISNDSADPSKSQKICGSGVFEVDSTYKIARAAALVVHPNFQRMGIATKILRHGSKYLLEDTRTVHSIYTTTRTLSVGPQLAFLKDHYIPLGVFPNAHRLATYETLTLMGKFRQDVLNRRKKVNEVPEALGPILKTLEKYVKSKHPAPRLLKMAKPHPSGEHLEFDLIRAPKYVQRKFFETFKDPFDRFYPFHLPNLLISARNGEVDIYGYLGEADGYCTLVCSSQPIFTLAGRLRPLMQQLHDFGVSYLEILMATDNILSLETLLDVNFLPSAIYPGMLEIEDEFQDLVLMSRSLEPLNFRGMHIEKSFMPYINQYVELWKQKHLEVLQVFNEK